MGTRPAGCGTGLTTRAGRKELVAGAGPVELLNAESQGDAWRLIEVYGSAPFDLDLGWSNGRTQGAGATLTIPRAGRVCVRARSLQILASSTTGQVVQCGVSDADDFVQTSNVYTTVGDLVLLGAFEVSQVAVPRWAKQARLYVGDYPAGLAGASIVIFDATGLILFKTTLDQVATDGTVPLPVGDAVSVWLYWPGAVPADVPVYRLIFDLTL